MKQSFFQRIADIMQIKSDQIKISSLFYMYNLLTYNDKVFSYL